MKNESLNNDIFEVMLKYASSQYVTSIEEEIKNCPKHIFSKQFELNMEKLIKQQKNKIKTTYFKKGLKVATIVGTLLITTSTIAIINVPALKSKFLSLTIDSKDKYDSIKPNIYYEIYDLSELSPEWEYIYIPKYIPYNYKVSSIYSNYSICKITFTNGNEDIIFTQYQSVNANIGIDNEDVMKEEIKINNFTGYSYSKKGHDTLIWDNNNYIFILMGKNNKDTLIEMAESLTTLKNNFK